MNFTTGPLVPETGKWYLTRDGLTVKVIATDLPSETGHSVIAVHYQPTSWSLQTYLATGRLSDTTDMSQDLIAETHEPVVAEEQQQ